MTASHHILLPGFAARSSRGFLGWSTVTLLRSKEGLALFDTGGNGDRVALLAALAALDLRPEDIATLILSHLHFDHIANAECFPKARIILHQTEIDYVEGKGRTDPAISAAQVAAVLQNPRLCVIETEAEVLTGITALHTPGHTDGHLSLCYRGTGGVVVLAQDAIKNRADIASGQPQGGSDDAAAAASLRRLVAMADVLVPGHDTTLRLKGGQITADEARISMSMAVTGQTLRLEY